MKFIFSILVFILALNANANTVSYHSAFSGTCNGLDQVAQYMPWESIGIKIIGVEIAVSEISNQQYIYAGNSYVANKMAWLGKNDTHHANWFPSGSFFYFPPIGTNGSPHVSLHVACGGSGTFQVNITIYYQPY